MANWAAEAQRFFPGTRVMIYEGSGRKKIQNSLYWTDLVITSYTTAANDATELNQTPWNYVVVDEAHAIKNPTIQRTKRVKQIAGMHKLALTGTPVQNSGTDLWSLFDYLMPGYLGTHSDFCNRYPRLDPRKKSQAGDIGQLKTRIKPFILRRMKKDVALDLPDKIIIYRIYELSAEQRRLYKQILEGNEVKELKFSIAHNDYAKKSVSILAILTRLRQICGHPQLVTGHDQWSVEDSAKLEALAQLLDEVVEGGHRALIFSQYTKMLDLIAPCLDGWKIRFLRIDGETPPAQRQQLVDAFNQDQSYAAMILSTRAGGVGLNLTGADTVIFYDHDWNPAMDSQAQDRAYRIGQTRDVTVYRLIMKGSIEEKMLAIQQRKKAISDSLVGVDEAGFKHLTSEELLSLFSTKLV